MRERPPAPDPSTYRAASAKVNLGLAITGRRGDGFHTLRSVFLRLALHDGLTATVTDQEHDALDVHGDPACPVDGNLVLEAASAIRTLVARPLPGIGFRLDKRIPVAAGLAGGSSDAAAALDLAAAVWRVPLGPARTHDLALRLGADVPFFASGLAAALVDGIGDGLRALSGAAPPAGVLLVTPATRLSTAAVFAAFDGVSPAPSPTGAAALAVERLAERLAAGITGGALASLAHGVRDANDLWLAATRLLPELAPLRDDLEAALGRPVLMTGSGSTLLALYPSPEEAAEAGRTLAKDGRPTVADARIIATRTM